VEKTEGRYDPELPAEIGDEEEDEEEDEVEEVDDDTQHQRLLEAQVTGSKAVEKVVRRRGSKSMRMVMQRRWPS
jgi:hypothetical protein